MGKSAESVTEPARVDSVSLSGFDADSLKQVVEGAYFEHRRLPGGSPGMRLLRCALPHISLDRGDYGPAVLVNGNFGPNAMTLGATLRSARPTVLNAIPVEPGHVQVYGEGAELCYRAWPEGSWLALVVPRQRLAQFCLDHFDELPALPDAGMVNVEPGSAALALHLAAALTDLTDSLRLLGSAAGTATTSGYEHTRAARLAESVEADVLLRMAGAVVEGAPENRSDDRVRWRRCRDILHDAMARVGEDPDEILDVISLASAAGITPRSVQRLFQTTCGLCPQEWFRIERLNRVHDELSDARSGGSVTRSATRWGFFHLGRFSQYYRKIFGERPSETLRRAAASRADRRTRAVGREDSTH